MPINSLHYCRATEPILWLIVKKQKRMMPE